MFDFFRRRTAKEFVEEANNVYNLPKLKSVPPLPEVTPPKKEEPGRVFYRLGLSDNNRVSLSMYYGEILMTHAGCQQLIDQLTFFQSQLYDEDTPTDDPDGGESVPVPEQKAA